MTVVGLEEVNYRSKKTDKDVSGFRFHLTDEDERKGLIGMQVLSEFVSDSIGRDLLRNFAKNAEVLGQVVELRYNRWGRVDKIDLVG